jgi:hypothetical protein
MGGLSALGGAPAGGVARYKSALAAGEFMPGAKGPWANWFAGGKGAVGCPKRTFGSGASSAAGAGEIGRLGSAPGVKPALSVGFEP